jgi:inosine-uridine nucleoside N-ribohydrolase
VRRWLGALVVELKMRRFLPVVLVIVLGLVLVPGTVGLASSPAPLSSGTAARPIVIDTDLGADDILAIAMLVEDPAYDVKAVTLAGTGLSHCDPGTAHLSSLLIRLGRPDIPFACGRQSAAPPAVSMPPEWRDGADTGYGLTLPQPASPTSGSAADLIGEVIGAADEPVTFVELAPWTNLADALAAAPGLVSRIAAVDAMGGAYQHSGVMWFPNGDPLNAEANFASDPQSIDQVLATGLPVSLVTLDATDHVQIPQDFIEQFVNDHASVGADLALELLARNTWLMDPNSLSYLWDETNALTISDPSMVTWKAIKGDVSLDPSQPGHIEETDSGWPMQVAVDADGQAVIAAIVDRLRNEPPPAQPFALSGELSATVDDGTCEVDATSLPPAGQVIVRVTDHSLSDVQLVLAGARAPMTLADVAAAAPSIRPDAGSFPRGVVPIMVTGTGGNTTGYELTQLPAGDLLPICAFGDPNAPTITVGAPFTIAGS